MKLSISWVVVLLAVVPAEASQLKVRSAAGSRLETSVALREVQQVMMSDARFFATEWVGLESQLSQLATLVDPDVANRSVKHKAHFKMPKVNLSPKTAADLAPTLAMLNSLYDDGKRRIAELNEREKKSKKDFDEKEAHHKKKLETIEARFANKTLSLEFRTNETHDEMRLFSYWQRCRERQHRQFHTGLKIQHATLSKVKKMIDMYEKTMSGKAEEVKQAKKDFQKMEAPEIVFLQERRAVVQFCEQSLNELGEFRKEISTDPLSGVLH